MLIGQWVIGHQNGSICRSVSVYTITDMTGSVRMANTALIQRLKRCSHVHVVSSDVVRSVNTALLSVRFAVF